MEETFADIEKDIDKAFRALPIFKLPLDVALIDCLTVFQRTMFETVDIRSFLPFDAAIVHFKEALQILVPELYRNCPTPRLAKYPFNTPRVLDVAQQALIFCTHYSSFIHSFTLHHYGWFEGHISDNIVSFSYPEGFNFGLGQLNLRLHIHREEKKLRQARETVLYPLSNPPEIVFKKLREMVQSKSRYILHSVPDEVHTAHLEIIKAGMPVPTIDCTSKIGSYTLGQYYDFWCEFAALMLDHYSFCRERSTVEDINQVIADSILSFTVDEIVTLVTRRLGLAAEIVKDMTREMVLNLNVKRPDILIQPLLPLPPDKVLIAPSLIFTANWELCLLRNWSQRYPDIYSRTIAQKKSSLANAVGTLFDSRRFIVETNRKLKDEHGIEVGDVDVAVFDPHEGCLALFEVKWILEADSARESKAAEDQILKGIKQVKDNKARFESDPQHFLDSVFRQRRLHAPDIKCVIIALVGNGDIGGDQSQHEGVPVFDYDLTSEVINELEGCSIEKILSSVSERHNAFAKEIAQKECVMKVKAAGYLLQLPGWGDTQPEDSYESGEPPKIFRTAPCPCGSGRKYKDCCKRIEQYSDNAL